MTVRELLRAIWNGRWYVVASVVVVVAVAYVYAQQQVITYRAAVGVELATIDDKVATAAGVQALVNPDVTAVTAPELLQTAAAQPGVSSQNLAKRVTVSFDATTHTVNVAADAPTVDEAVATVNAVAAAYVAAVPAEIQAQLADIDKQVADLHTRLATAQAAIAKDPNDQFAQADITAAVARYQSLMDARSAYQQVGTPARIATPATDAIPLGLGPGAILALGALAGLVVGLGVAMAHRGLSNRLRTASEATRIAKAPVIAQLEDVSRAVRTFRVRGLLPVAGRAATPYTESIRELRTALRLSMSQRPHAVVVVTATDTAAPRAFIAANLAASWALSGRRTIVFCGDMRRQEMADLLPLASSPSAEPGAPRPTLVPNLSVVPVPDTLLDPADYLATDEVRARVEELRSDADIIVIDAPPVLAAADATILGTYADGAVLVATVDKSDRSTLEAASERLQVSGVTVFGVVLSGVRGSRRKSYASTYGGDTPPATRHASRQAHPPRTASSGSRPAVTPAPAAEHAVASGAVTTVAAPVAPASHPVRTAETWQPNDASEPLRTAKPRPITPREPENDEPIPVPELGPEDRPAVAIQDVGPEGDEEMAGPARAPRGNRRP